MGRIHAPELNVPAREWDQGFPGVKNLLEWFAISFEAELSISEPASYQFRVISDDGSKIYLDGDLIIDNDGIHAPKLADSPTINLEPGRHVLKVDWFQGPRNQIALQIFWRIDGGDFQILDQLNLSYTEECLLKDLGTFD